MVERAHQVILDPALHLVGVALDLQLLVVIEHKNLLPVHGVPILGLRQLLGHYHQTKHHQRWHVHTVQRQGLAVRNFHVLLSLFLNIQ